MTNATREQKRMVFERMLGKVVAGKYRITGLLGFGGMGAVYEAVQSPMERKVALKLIPTYDTTAATRFEREATTVSKLTHPNTVTVFDYGQTDDGHLYLAMEHLTGYTLTDLVRAQGPLEPRRVVHIAAQICRSLNEAHRIGIIHRDIKPDNIFLIQVDRDPDYVKVLDFGIAKAVHGHHDEDVNLTAEGRIVGTPRYMSPEQILAQPMDHRADIYSLGCIIFEMICAGPPFTGTNTASLMISHAQQQPPSFLERLDSASVMRLPPGLESVVLRAMAKNPAARQPNTEALREELEQALRINQAYSGAPSGHYTGPQQPLPSYHTGQHTGPHGSPPSLGATPSGQHAPMPTGQHAPSPTGSFERHTGDFARQTGDLPVAPGGFTGSFAGNQTPLPAPTRSKKPLIAVGVMLVVVLGLIALLVFKPNPNDKRTPGEVIAPPRDTAGVVAPQDSAPAEVLFRIESSPEGASLLTLPARKFITTTPHTLSLAADAPPTSYVLSRQGYQEAQITLDPAVPDENFFTIDLIREEEPAAPAKVITKRDPISRKPPRKPSPPPVEPTPTQPTPAVEPLKPKQPLIELLEDKPNDHSGIGRLP